MDNLVIHPSHDPEPDGMRLYDSGQSCRTCCLFVFFDGPTVRVTSVGAAPCRLAPAAPRGKTK